MPRPNDRFYDLLEVSPQVSPRGLRIAYQRTAERLQAKAGRGDNNAADRLSEVHAAYSVLSNPERRRLYDAWGERGLEPGFQPPHTDLGPPPDAGMGDDPFGASAGEDHTPRGGGRRDMPETEAFGRSPLDDDRFDPYDRGSRVGTGAYDNEDAFEGRTDRYAQTSDNDYLDRAPAGPPRGGPQRARGGGDPYASQGENPFEEALGKGIQSVLHGGHPSDYSAEEEDPFEQALAGAPSGGHYEPERRGPTPRLATTKPPAASVSEPLHEPPPRRAAPPPPPPEPEPDYIDPEPPRGDPSVQERDWDAEFVGDEAGSAQARVVDGVLEVRIPFRLACKGGTGKVIINDKQHSVPVRVGTQDGDESEVNGVPLRFRVLKDRVFERRGKDLFLTLMIEPGHAFHGVECMVPTLFGHKPIKVPKRSRTADLLRLKGEGVPYADQPGDLFVSIRVLPKDTGRVTDVGLGSGER